MATLFSDYSDYNAELWENSELILRSYSWERRHPAGLPPGMAALPVRNISSSDNCTPNGFFWLSGLQMRKDQRRQTRLSLHQI